MHCKKVYASRVLHDHPGNILNLHLSLRELKQGQCLRGLRVRINNFDVHVLYPLLWLCDLAYHIPAGICQSLNSSSCSQSKHLHADVISNVIATMMKHPISCTCSNCRFEQCTNPSKRPATGHAKDPDTSLVS